jgi:hypothetical protein
MKKLLFLLFMLLSISSFSQVENNIEYLIVPNIKTYYLNQTDKLYSKKQIVNFLNDSTNYGLLKSKGFDMNYVFIKIKQRGNFDKVLKRKTSDSLFINNKVPLSCDFIIGLNKATKKFYRLKGFEKNDFDLLFNDCSIESKESLINLFKVEELDLACLFDYYFLKQKDCYNKCIRSCRERDNNFIKLRHN